MNDSPCAPLEVVSVLELHPDYDTAVRCLEFIRQHFSRLFPKYRSLDIKLMALCHHSPDNTYPALSIVGSTDGVSDSIDQVAEAVDQWVTEVTLVRLVEMAAQVSAPSWSEVMGVPIVITPTARP